MGAIIGRYANRIANGNLVLNKKIYNLENNENGNHLHGGTISFHNKIWSVEKITQQIIQFFKLLQ